MMRKRSSLQPPARELGPAWQAWLAGDRSALASLAAQSGDSSLAKPARSAAAAAALLAEHQAAERFTLRAVLAARLADLLETPSGSDASGFAALAAAGLLESYGEWPTAARVSAASVRRAVAALLAREVAVLIEAAGDADLLLLACCGLGEWCEREGREVEFERVAVGAALLDATAAPWPRLHWRIVAAWHHWSIGRRDEARQALSEARRIGAEAGLAAGVTLAELQTARLVTSVGDTAAARAAAAAVRVIADPARCPLWLADAADIEARAALADGNFRDAVAKSRQALAWLEAAGVAASYRMTYRLREVCALGCLGDLDSAAACIAAIDATPLPAFLAARVRVLTGLLALLPHDAQDRWGPVEDARLADLLQRLSSLVWPTILSLLPVAMARLFARGLNAGCEVAWLQRAIRDHGLDPPLQGGAARPRLWPWPVRVRLLGAFECDSASRPVADGVRAPAKPMALMRQLALHDANTGVAVATVAQLLWPGEGREGREKALETTLARLRKLLCCADAIVLHEQRLRLNPLRVWCDWPALLRSLDRIEASPRDNASRGWDEVFTLWRGPLLGDDDGQAAWLRPWRERMRNRIAAALLATAATRGHAARCRRAISLDPGIEALLREP